MYIGPHSRPPCKTKGCNERTYNLGGLCNACLAAGLVPPPRPPVKIKRMKVKEPKLPKMPKPLPHLHPLPHEIDRLLLARRHEAERCHAVLYDPEREARIAKYAETIRKELTRQSTRLPETEIPKCVRETASNTITANI